MIENQDKRIQELTDYYSKKSNDWAREIIARERLVIENLEKERLVEDQKLEDKRLAKERRLKNRRFANERRKKNRQLRQDIKLNKIKNKKLKRLSNIKGIKIKDNILPNIKIPNKRLFSMIEMNQKEKIKFHINENKIKRLGFNPSVNKLACKFFDYCNKVNYGDGQYANNGGERKVWYTKNRHYKLDYISDRDKTIVEWNEDGHYDPNGVIQKRDLVRKGRILLFYPDYSYIIVKESDYFLSNKGVNSGVKTRIFGEILVEINKKLKKL